MLLRLTKEIDVIAAKKLELAKKQVAAFTGLVDTKFLQEELNENLEEKLNAFSPLPDPSYLLLLQEELGAFPEPEHFMLKDWGEFSYKYNRKAHKKPQKYLLTVAMYKKYPPASKNKEFEFELKISRKGAKGPLEEFSFGEFAGSSASQKMFDFFNYFACQRAMYTVVAEKLLAKKPLLEKYAGATFTEDLLKLFACETLPSEIFALAIKKESLEKRIFFNSGTNRDIIDKATCLISGIWDTKDEVESAEALLFRGVELRLAATNHLLIDFDLDEAGIVNFPTLLTDQNLAQFMNAKAFSNFLTKNLENWLEDLVNYANFATQIFNKIKTKFLLKTISKI